MTVIYIYCVNCLKFGQLILTSQESHLNCCHEVSHFKAENAPNSISAGAPPRFCYLLTEYNIWVEKTLRSLLSRPGSRPSFEIWADFEYTIASYLLF